MFCEEAGADFTVLGFLSRPQCVECLVMRMLLQHIVRLVALAAAMVLAVQPAEVCCRLAPVSAVDAGPSCCQNCPNSTEQTPTPERCECCVIDAAVLAESASGSFSPVVWSEPASRFWVDGGRYREFLSSAFSDDSRYGPRDHLLQCVWRC